MSMEEKEINLFFNNITSVLNGKKSLLNDKIILNDDLLNNKECYYIFDLTKGDIVYHKDFGKVLGYNDTKVSYNMLLKNYHPDDIETILRISKATILHCISKPFECKNSLLQISYRLKKSDGSYAKILSQSTAYKMNKEGMMTHILVKMTDISFLENTRYVNWHFNAEDLDSESFKKQIYSAYQDFFTDRETDIIKEIAKGLSTKEIARKLNISEYTVSTHRKNILKKANRHNTEDLILFCKRKGVI